MVENVAEPKPSKQPTPAVSGPLAPLEAWLYDMLVVKAPFQLPKGLTDFLVQYGPWITLVIGILFLPAVLAVFTLGSLVGVAATPYVGVAGPLYWVALVLLVVQVAVMFISVPMLLKRQRNGWLLVFYANLLSFAYSVFNSFAYDYLALGSLIGAVIGLVIGLYVLFQIRSYYVN